MTAPDRRMKEPWLAVCLSWLVPGVGQCYAGGRATGLLFLVGWFGLQTVALWQVVSAHGRLVTALPAVAGGLVIWVVAVLHAHGRARKANPPEAEAARRGVRDPYLGVFLTQILPGIGHLYLKRWIAGPLLLVGSLAVWLAGLALPALLPAVAAVTVFGIVLSVYEAGASLWAYYSGPPQRRRGAGGIAAVCLVGLAVGTLPMATAFLLRQHVVEAFHIPAASMAPTLKKGDMVLVWKRPFEPRRGDLVVFRNPWERQVRYVKRVVALEGETIEVRTDGVYVDGKRLAAEPFGAMRDIPVLRHAGPSRTYGEQGEPFIVPPGHIYVLGDNVGRSVDSRLFGPVPLKDVIGRVYKRYWPPSRAGPVGPDKAVTK
ncbi:MAG: signal peptidase I [Phycisphaerae bacterium]